MLGDVGPEAAELAGEGGQPVGLVAPDVADAAQVGGTAGQRAERRDGRGELADVVQVEVDAPELAGAGAPAGRRR